MNKNPVEIIDDLNNKFLSNIVEWKSIDHSLVTKSFLLARAISEIGQILSLSSLSKHRLNCCGIFDEIFSDTISAVYLATCSIDNPAKIVLRRVVEMGVSAMYLWDMPHTYYGWELLGEDLSFSEMIAHLNSAGYRQYVAVETGKQIENEIILVKIKDHYGTLSDVVHGRITFFTSKLPDRFTFNAIKWNTFIEMTNDILLILFNAYCVRFNIKDKVIKNIPALTKI